jgi:hypothetical protein
MAMNFLNMLDISLVVASNALPAGSCGCSWAMKRLVGDQTSGRNVDARPRGYI